jgi:hypothetical protein
MDCAAIFEYFSNRSSTKFHLQNLDEIFEKSEFNMMFGRWA